MTDLSDHAWAVFRGLSTPVPVPPTWCNKIRYQITVLFYRSSIMPHVDKTQVFQFCQHSPKTFPMPQHFPILKRLAIVVEFFLYNEEALFEFLVYSLQLGSDLICVSKNKPFYTFRLRKLSHKMWKTLIACGKLLQLTKSLATVLYPNSYLRLLGERKGCSRHNSMTVVSLSEERVLATGRAPSHRNMPKTLETHGLKSKPYTACRIISLTLPYLFHALPIPSQLL